MIRAFDSFSEIHRRARRARVRAGRARVGDQTASLGGDCKVEAYFGSPEAVRVHRQEAERLSGGAVGRRDGRVLALMDWPPSSRMSPRSCSADDIAACVAGGPVVRPSKR